MDPSKSRIKYLDGLRGVAILLVVLFHSYARWQSIYPYKDMFNNVKIFYFGWIGVQLFFIISGFVIALTLEKSKSMSDFMIRRWLRLFPAMFVCSLFVFLTAPLFSERPEGQPALMDLLPGISFINEWWWYKLLHVQVGLLDGSFWSLFVEVKFYIVFGTLYFLVGSTAAIGVMFAFFILAKIVPLLPFAPTLFSFNLSWAVTILRELSAQHFGWFVAGALFYRYKTGDARSLVSALLVSGIAALVVRDLMLGAAAAGFAVALLFSVSLISESAQKILSQRWLLFFGFISYPLYLIHQNMMVAMIIKLGLMFPAVPPILVPAIPLFVVAIISWGIANWLEVPLRNFLASVLARCKHAAITLVSA